MKNSTEHPQAPRRLFQILVPIMSLGLTLGLLELGLEIFYPIPFSVEENMYFEADPYTGFRLKPGGIGHFQHNIPAVANSHGHRDVETPLKKPLGVFRILVIGDLLTVGANVRQEEAYPKVLEERLRRVYGPQIQVVNSGVGGWDPFQYAEYFEHYGYQFEPDLIVVGFFVGNDTFDSNTSPAKLPTAINGRRISSDAAVRPFIKFKIFLYRHSNLARLLLNPGIATSDDFDRKRCDDFTDWYLAIQRARLINHLRYSSLQRDKTENAVNQIRRIRDRAGDSVPVIAVLLPDENQVNPALQKRSLSPITNSLSMISKCRSRC